MTYDRIVVGTDGSAGSAAAVGWAAETARTCKAQVSLVHGIAPLLEAAFSIPPLQSDEVKRLARAELATAWSEPLRRAEVEFETVLVDDVAAAALLECANDTQASLVVLGRHGHTHWAPHVLGGVVHKVLSTSPSPVIIVPPSWKDSSNRGRGHVVVGVDGSDSSLSALDWAIRHAEALGLGVRAVTAVFTQVYTDVAWLAATDDAKAGHAAEVQLERIVDRRRASSDIQLETKVILGHTGESLVAESEEAELVVVGSRGLGTVAALLTGSTSHYVATRSACPAGIVV